MSPQSRVPLKSQEVEDIVIYLSSLGKHNSITMDNLASTYKQWSLAQQRSTLTTATESTYPPPPLPVQGGKLTLREADHLATVSNLEGGRATISFLPGAAEA